MSTKHIYLKDLHEEHKLWLNEVNLYEDELLSLENRLGEVVTKNTSSEVLAPLEHFQNSIIRHKEVIDEIKHNIGVHEQHLAKFAEENQTAIDRKYFEDHPYLRNQVTTERALFQELRTEAMEYLAKTM
jgi:hypothetical protein